jgi:hypothetical protein
VQHALAVLDGPLAASLARGDIRLVRAAWICAQPAGFRMPRRQELESLEGSGSAAAEASPLLSPQEAVKIVNRGCRAVGALTYGWLTPGEPDPTGARIVAVRTALEKHQYIEGLFWECVILSRLDTPSRRPACLRSV